MKPILFNTEMVCPIQLGLKTATRRAPFCMGKDYAPRYGLYLDDFGRHCILFEHREDSLAFVQHVKAPYAPGDILYVRETWRVQSARRFDADARIEFKAGGNMVRIQFPGGGDQYHSRAQYDDFVRRWADDRWHPSIHMPREAARIFLRVTDVKVQRVQDITEEDARKEGAKKMYPYTDPETGETVYAYSEDGTYIAGFACVWNNCYAKPQPVKVKGVIRYYKSYPWEDIQETRNYRGKPWYVFGNPWVFANEFERCEKPEGTR